MKLTVLGRYGPFPMPGGACSAYLLESGGPNPTRIALDFGAGALSRLRSSIQLEQLHGVALSHLHGDHMSDMLVLRYALQLLPGQGVPVKMPLPVIAPAAPEAEYGLLEAGGYFALTPAADGRQVRMGDFTIRLHRMVHPVPSYAMVITEQGSRETLVYTGDTGMHEGLLPICKDASLLLADAGLLTKPVQGPAAHLSPAEVGALAREAGVKRLLLSHLWGGGPEEARMLREAQAVFENVEVAQEMRCYEV